MRRPLAVLLATFLAPAAFANAKITIHNIDAAGTGFNDPTPVAPVGGNPGTTLGQQRLNAFQKAADVWSGIINSDVEIVIDATFSTLPCDAVTAVLGSAGPTEFIHGFANAPSSSIWYPVALADALSHQDLKTPGSADIKATFNAQLDTGACLGGLKFYYGFDGNHGNDVDLVPVLLHEFGHGLGFIGSESLTNGDELDGLPSVFATHVLDDTTGLRWDQMTSAQRLASVTDTGNLVWDGPSATEAAAKLLDQNVTMTVSSPAAIARNYVIGHANFGADPATSGVSGTLVVGQHVARLRRTTADGCTAFENAAELAGNIAVVDRGNCTFVTKARNAQAAGAVGLVIVDNVRTTCIPQGMNGSDATVHIPVVSITASDGDVLKAQVPNHVNVAFHVDPSQLAGEDRAGFVRLYSPCTFKAGSSVFHWDVAATPNLLMEPVISSDLSHGVDITVNQLMDIGWTTTTQQ